MIFCTQLLWKWKSCSAIIQSLPIRFLPYFAHATPVQLPCQEQNFKVIRLVQFGLKWNNLIRTVWGKALVRCVQGMLYWPGEQYQQLVDQLTYNNTPRSVTIGRILVSSSVRINPVGLRNYGNEWLTHLSSEQICICNNASSPPKTQTHATVSSKKDRLTSTSQKTTRAKVPCSRKWLEDGCWPKRSSSLLTSHRAYPGMTRHCDMVRHS